MEGLEQEQAQNDLRASLNNASSEVAQLQQAISSQVTSMQELQGGLSNLTATVTQLAAENKTQQANTSAQFAQLMNMMKEKKAKRGNANKKARRSGEDESDDDKSD